MTTEDPLMPDNVKMDYRYRGYLYDLQRPRIPITGAIGNREGEKKFPLPNSLVRGHPVFPPTPAKGFTFGSENIRDQTEDERRENRMNLRLLNKTSADIRRQKREADEQATFISAHKEARKRQALLRRREQEEDLQQLKSYNPFGKPGYGAPRNGDAAISNKLQSKDGVGLVVESSERRSIPMRNTWEPKIQQRDPGRLKVRRYEDDQMRRYAVSRETAQAYKRDLDELREIKRRNEEQIERVEKARETEMLTYDPFGKPGAGAPNRDDKGKMKVARKYRQQFFPPAREEGATYDPWEKDLPRIDSKGNARRYPRAGENGIYEFVDPDVPGEVFPRKHVGGGGEPLLDDKGDILTKRMGNLTTIHGARRTENIPRVATPDDVRQGGDKVAPWGKPGAGAPLKDERGNVVKNTKGTIDKEQKNITQSEASMRTRAKEIYRTQLQEGMVVQRSLRDQEKEFLMQPPGDVPSWFSKGKVGRPHRDPETGLIQPQKRIMSDVTAQKLASDRPKNVDVYYRELKEQAEERRKMRVKEKERVAQLEAKPFPYRVVAPWAIDA